MVVWLVFFLFFGQSSKLQYILRRFPTSDVLEKTFQRGRNLTVFNLELDCFIKGIM